MTAAGLYQELVLDHQKRPRNFFAMTDATSAGEGVNPLCGDQFKVFVKVEGGRVEAVSFQGTGCAISTASASLMTDAIKGKTLAEALSLFESFHELVMGQTLEPSRRQALGKLAAMGGVSAFPMRVKCASIAWHALKNALREAS
jgi:nitrogen fixation NifU-like protein